ncbi:mucin-5B-like [Rhincodon typus]|uniref:mucin-5B-like n=1 Tax=Rhincodon typus TaxID=259920 RepID=UPI00202E95B3|nr:mucin-5B-like [Rhincodon typus]
MPMPQTMPSLGHNPNHNFRVCSTWGNYHFKTFDGDVYYFPGTCNYVFASQCLSSYEEFNIQMRRSIVNGLPRITHIVLKVDGSVIEVQNSVTLADDNVVTLPYTHSGIVIEKVSNYIRITAKIGLTLIWNGDDALTLELGQQFVNTTCGLCGDFNGIQDNEFFLNGYHLTPIQYGNLQKLNDPKEQCNDVSSSDNDKNCSNFESMCERALTDPGFSNCYDILDLAPFIKSCMLDLCLCKDSENPSSCMCNTLSEFSRQCAHVGGKPSNWRRKEMCEKTCQFNMTYEECGIPCADTCSNPDRSQMCEDHCIDGCFCAPNTVFDDISNTGCIPKEQCPCTYNGLSYAPGESYSTKCSKCNCNGGQWSCTDLSCPGICSVEGGAHINTFDEKQYKFHGNCHYVLAKDCNNTFFTVLGDLHQCGITESETCLKSVSLTEHRSQTVSQIITINPSGRVSVNGIFTELPLTVANLTIFMPSSFHVIIHTSFGLQLQVQLVPIMQLYITLDSVFKSRMCGLCGNFNNVLNDEFKIVSGLVEGTPAAFANTWKTKASCPDRKDIHENPCSLSVVNEKYAKHWCGLLLADNSTFTQCHSHVNPNQYFEQCKYDSCNCEKSEDCMCAALSSYVQACATKGIVISNWRMNVCSKYLTCPKTLIYNYNMTSCHRTCKSLGAPDKTCEIDFVPVDGCGCATGTYMDETGKCVPPSSCPCYYRGLTVPAGEVIHEEDAMCTCNQGKLEWIGKELKLQACVAPMVYFDCNNASADSVGTECQKSCQTLDMECYATGCVSGCVCPEGLVSDGSCGCIPINQCPCTHNGIQYHSGDIVQVDCNSCECKNRLWTCTNQQCHGTCMIYGDGNYITFDGKRYNFNGNCEYIVAQDYCGNNTSDGTFRVITENMPCGTTGTTCSKSIKIFLGNLEIKLSGGKYEVVKFGSGKHIPYEVRYLGIYLVIEAKNGLVLIWDKKTSLTIKLSHSFQGTICGLCGNYDGNVHNDFTTRNQLVVVNKEEFGNSWKLSPACPNVKKNEDPCSINPHRDAWAQKQCSILKDKPFLACNSQVNPTPYYEACVRDACACDSGGDCECLCTAIAAYSLACSTVGVCISWRNPEFCPLFCDYYNPDDECEWHYAPCGIPCLKTCRNPGGACSKIIPKLEGCYPDCPDDKPFLDEDRMKCVDLDHCPCYVNGNHYEPGHIVPSTQNCESCSLFGRPQLPVLDDAATDTEGPPSLLALPALGHDAITAAATEAAASLIPPTSPERSRAELTHMLRYHHTEPRYNETWLLCECLMATCIEKNIISIQPVVCPTVEPVECANGHEPVKVYDKNGCCYHYECDCYCNGWGGSHFVTFDGQYYTYDGNCTYILMEETNPSPTNFGIYIDNYHCDTQDSVLCPRAIIVKFEELDIQITNIDPTGIQHWVTVNDSIVSLPYSRDDVKISSSGLNVMLEIPKLKAFVTFNGLVFSIKLPSEIFGNNTQGQCGQAVVTSVGKSDLCNFTLCTKSCETIKYTGKCQTTTAPTTTPSESATTVTVTPSSTETTRCSCHVNGQALSPGQAVVTSVGKSDLCNFTLCAMSCEIINYTGKCQTTTAPTTTPSETATTVTVTPSSTETTRCSCHVNGHALSPGQAVVTSVGKSDLCNFTLCTKSCEIIKYTGKCQTTTAPATTPSESATTVTVTPSSTETTRCFCDVNGRTFSPGEIVYHSRDKEGWCFYALCSENCRIVKYMEPCGKPTSSLPTMESPTPTTMPPGGCSALHPPRAVNETWKLGNCTVGICTGNNNVSVVPVKCPPVNPVTCQNGRQPKRVYDQSGCCYQYKCDYCIAPDGKPIQVGETWQHNCQDCSCDNATLSIVCKPHKCSLEPPVVCKGQGFVPVVKRNESDPCCPVTKCECNVTHCPTLKFDCKPGYEPVYHINEDKCCPSYKCEPKPVCVFNDTEYKPGMVIPQGPCENCKCTNKTDPSTQHKTIECTTIPCDSHCPPGFKYKEVKGQCCGKCTQVDCIIEVPNQPPIILQPGAVMSDSKNNCTKYECKKIGSHFVPNIYHQRCPQLDPDNCEPGTMHMDSDGCCQKCIPKTCTVSQTTTYINHQGCRSKQNVSMTYCEGRCLTYSMYSPEANTISHNCTCCQELATGKQNITLICPDDTTIEFTYTYVKNCGCVSTKC